nr:beta-galactosidase [Litorihabitans aurantiacus]
MAHGGTNFGLWAGANREDGELLSTVTSYDSDAPIAEDGTLTEKFFAMREALGASAPIVSQQPRTLAARTLPTTPGRNLDDALDLLAGPAVDVATTVAFEDLSLDAGMLLLDADVLLPGDDVSLAFPQVADRATVRLDGRRLGAVQESGSIDLGPRGVGGTGRLHVIVENLGRVNYGWSLGERKGLLAPALLGRRAVQRWRARPLDLADAGPDDLTRLRERSPGESGSPAVELDGAGVAFATPTLTEVADTHLALPGFERGLVWVNDFLLGRYWEVGPQETLYVPAPLLHRGENVITVLELERRGSAVELRARPSLGPEESYIEEF